MRKVDSKELQDLGILKYYRIIRRWACDKHGLTLADYELIMYLDAHGLFNKIDFMKGNYILNWDKERWKRMRNDGWITIWRRADRRTRKYNIYKTSLKAKMMVARVYKMMLGEEEIPVKVGSPYYENKRYKEKILNMAIHDMKKDMEKRFRKEEGLEDDPWE